MASTNANTSASANTKPSLRDTLRKAADRAAGRARKLLPHPPPPPKPARQPLFIDAYLEPYVREVLKKISQGRICLLLGVLGTGKSDVLRLVKADIEKASSAKCVLIDVGQDRMQMTSHEMLRQILADIGDLPVDTPLESPDIEGELRRRLFDWMKRNRSDIVLLIDQVELLDRDADILRTLRALHQQQDYYAGQENTSVRFLAVLTSTQTLRRRLAGETSPIFNLVDVLRMEDVPLLVRHAYWRDLLADLPPEVSEPLVKQLNALCGGDPYQIENAAVAIRTELERASSHPLDIGHRIESIITRIKSNPESIAPHLRRYAELIEDDLEALQLLIRLDNGEQVPVREMPAVEEGRTACLWGGVFQTESPLRKDDGIWRYRSELTRRYFTREVIQKPERMARGLRRRGHFEEAVQHLANFSSASASVMNSLQDVASSWINSAKTPSEAWQILARVLSVWFGDGAQLLRYYSHRQRAARASDAYYRVEFGKLQTRADRELSEAIRQAYRERKDEARSSDLAYRPFAGDERVIFPLIRDRREYGAIVWTPEAYRDETQAVSWKQDLIDRWVEFFNSALRIIAEFERRSFSDLDPSRVQRIVQESRQLAQIPRALHLVLTTITTGWGLEFNRAVLLQAIGNRRLRGRAAIGYHSQREAHDAWDRGGDLPATFDEAVKRAFAPTLDAADLTPMHNEALQFEIEDWTADPLLRTALATDEPTVIHRDRLTGSALAFLMRVDRDANGEAQGQDNPVIVMPLHRGDPSPFGFNGADASAKRPGSGLANSAGLTSPLLGVLIVDQPFTHASVSQDQLDLLPNFANQLAAALVNEVNESTRLLFNDLSGIIVQRWSLQETLDEIANTLRRHLGHMISQLVISLWEETDGSDPAYPNRRQSTWRVIDSDRVGRSEEWQYFYYTGQERCLGPVDQALREPSQELHIRDLAAWRHDHDCHHSADFDSDSQTVFSIALRDGTLPRGVLSFQSRWPDAYTESDLDLFRRLKIRIANALEKARVYEGLSRAKHHTDQLNEALAELLDPRTQSELYQCILEQMREFFVGDGHSLERKRKPDSLALFALDKRGVCERLVGDASLDASGRRSGSGPECVERLVMDCARMREHAVKQGPVFIEHASGELVARELYGEEDCARHASTGAEASAWTSIGRAGNSNLLLVMAWETPRRMNHTERRALPVLAEIAARTNGVLEQERAAMKEQLAHSLLIEDFALIEAEYTHQWNKRIRAIRNYAKWALEDMGPVEAAVTQTGDASSLDQVKERLRKIEQLGAEAIERLSFTSKVLQTETISIKAWLSDLVMRWNLLNAGGGLQCGLELRLDDDHRMETRPTILNWILTELLGNAREAEANAPKEQQRITLSAGFNALTRDYEITLNNGAQMPRTALELIRSGSPLARPNKSGRGIWIAARQVSALLSGNLILPALDASDTAFTLMLPERLSD